jgi:hypothetical protein
MTLSGRPRDARGDQEIRGQSYVATRDGPEQWLVIRPEQFREPSFSDRSRRRAQTAKDRSTRPVCGSARQRSLEAAQRSALRPEWRGRITDDDLWPSSRRAKGPRNRRQPQVATRDGPQHRLVIWPVPDSTTARKLTARHAADNKKIGGSAVATTTGGDATGPTGVPPPSAFRPIARWPNNG